MGCEWPLTDLRRLRGSHHHPRQPQKPHPSRLHHIWRPWMGL